MALRTADQARAELKAKGVSITQWAIANRFSPNLVFEVLGGRKKCVRGQAHEIAIKLGLKAGEICVDPAAALSLRVLWREALDEKSYRLFGIYRF